MTDNISDAENNIVFDPPVYVQRYCRVQAAILNHARNHAKKVVDFGCAELSFFTYLKRLFGVQETVFVDVDEELLRNSVHRVQPLSVDYLDKKTEPLTVHILAGSISEPNSWLENADVITGIEVIEHVYPDTLEALPYNIFGVLKPRVAIFTTPNADFNVLFPNFQGFRHDDHKFEWTREQFQSWALNITSRFPDYSVSFEQIGYGPKGTEHLGACSQMAIFLSTYAKEENFHHYKNSSANPCVRMDGHSRSFGVCTYQSYSLSLVPNIGKYSHVSTIEYPYLIDRRTREEILLHNILYRINIINQVGGMYYNYEEHVSEIPIYELNCNEYGCFASVKEVEEALLKAGWRIERSAVIYDHGESMSDRSSCEDRSSDAGGADGLSDAPLSDWEAEEPAKAADEPSGAAAGAVAEVAAGAAKKNFQLSADTALALSVRTSLLKRPEERTRPDPAATAATAATAAAAATAATAAVGEAEEQDPAGCCCSSELTLEPDFASVMSLNEASASNMRLVYEEPADTLAAASREALFDPDSEMSLLEDALEVQGHQVAAGPEYGTAAEPTASRSSLAAAHNVDSDQFVIAADDPFPPWLLRLISEENRDNDDFYSQGDGLGVHPSLVDLEDTDTSSEDSTDTDTASGSSLRSTSSGVDATADEATDTPRSSGSEDATVAPESRSSQLLTPPPEPE